MTLLYNTSTLYRINRYCYIKVKDTVLYSITMSMVLKSVNDKGEFIRKASKFRHWVTGILRVLSHGCTNSRTSVVTEGWLGADGSSGFNAETGRYHLYVALACPWAHRTLIYRKLKGLEDAISVNVVDWLLGENGWSFTDKKPGCTLDTVNNFQYIKETYFKVDPDYNGSCTVPVLYEL